MKSIIYFLACYFFISLQVNAQELKYKMYNYNKLVNRVNRANLGITEENADQFYLFKEWSSGNVYAKHLKSTSQKTKFNYFVFKQEIHMVDENKDTLYIEQKAICDSIIIKNHKFVYLTSTNSKNSYFEQLNDGDFKLLKKYQCVFIKNNARTASPYQEYKPDRYEIRTNLYFQANHSPAVELKKSKKALLQIFPDHKKDIQHYIKKNKVKKEQDLVKLFNYYNSLK